MSVTNIFLFRDIIKVKIGIGEPSGITSPSDGQVAVEGNITYTYDLSSTNWDISVQTNQIYVNGLTTRPTNLSFSSGEIWKNGTNEGTSTTVVDTDIVRLKITNPTLNSIQNY